MCALNFRCEIIRLGCAWGIGALLIFAMTATASAGILMTDTSDQPITHGSITDVGEYYIDPDDPDDTYGLQANLEYAVYYGSAPTIGLTDPDFLGKYIYAYEIFNQDISTVNINAFSLGTHGYQGIANVSSVFDPDPFYTSHTPLGGEVIADFKSVKWSFYNGTDSDEILPGDQSNILYFTSPFGPGTATATLVGGPGANINDPNNEPPSPVPEPGTGVLMIIGAVILLLASAVRRIYGR